MCHARDRWFLGTQPIALDARVLQGLQDAIDLCVTHPTWQRTRPGQDEHAGWAFASPDDLPFSSATGQGSFPPKDVIPDTVNGAKFVRDLYEMTGNDPGARHTRAFPEFS
jgi:glutathionyl-hydroquinone reductase